ncbi:MAG: hypothetical protein ACK5L5_05480 [Bacteroidales bacterium]
MSNALRFFGGVPKAIVTDNLESAVSRASKYEAEVNRSLKEFALHYGCVINPTRIYSPQDKALVSDNFDERIDQKVFHAEIIVDIEKVSAETKDYQSIVEICSFLDEHGNDQMEATIEQNYWQVKKRHKPTNRR